MVYLVKCLTKLLVGGFAKISHTDIDGSSKFLKFLLKAPEDGSSPGPGCDRLRWDWFRPVIGQAQIFIPFHFLLAYSGFKLEKLPNHWGDVDSSKRPVIGQAQKFIPFYFLLAYSGF